ncbi:MAG: hypothetical protein IT454_22085 [Planctomycetes bacterium]|nr:hypothetical protein [Planctomycetota bacterium]
MQALHTRRSALNGAGLVLGCLLVFVLSCVVSSREGTAVHEWWSGRGPVVPHDSFPADCSLCHEGRGWDAIRADFSFDHAKETGVALQGAHAAAECLRCHNDRGPVAVFAARGCAGCHEDPHRTQMGADCSVCHEQGSWRPNEVLATHARTRFPLIGAHAVAACWRCHPGAQSGNFARVDTACEACHEPGTNPDHRAQLPPWTSDCQRCHVPTAWGGSAFNHSSWPLTGQHAEASCTQCHTAGQFAGTPRDCFDCHASDFSAANDPNHVAAGFSQACRSCHSTQSWQGANYNHAHWPLTGQHSGLDCQQCHSAGVYTGQPAQCVACHLADYQGTTDPDHVANNVSQSCENCHSTSGWDDAAFDHAGITNNCVSCHLPDYQGTTSPNHAQLGYPQTCEQCHNTLSWDASTFDHSGISNSCVQCHLTDWQGSTHPNHVQLGLSQTCEACHTSTNWLVSNFDHSGVTTNCVACHLADYQATTQPGHAQLGLSQTCESCHGTNNWDVTNFNHAGITSNCVQCHLADYQASTQPNHVQLGLSQTCQQCHSTNDWVVTNFNHSGVVNNCVACHLADYQGATNPSHTQYGFSQSCQQCHVTSTWDLSSFNHSGISNNCANCHLADYQTSQDPNHGAASFGQVCEQCHTSTSNWRNENWNHTWFPIKSGKHNNFLCSQCHLTNTNYTTFSCTHCHEHRQSQMNSEHQGVNGYQWVSAACYQCHPDGDD